MSKYLLLLEELLVHALLEAIAYEGNLYATYRLALITFFYYIFNMSLMVNLATTLKWIDYSTIYVCVE
jgi:hypothetical protein